MDKFDMDERPIMSIWCSNDSHEVVGQAGVTKIEIRCVPGQGAYVPWFAVWKGAKLYAAVNAAFVVQVFFDIYET